MDAAIFTTPRSSTERRLELCAGIICAVVLLLLAVAAVIDVPEKATESPPTYVVVSGDSLSGIARDCLGNAHRWPEIADLNALAQPDLIYVGQVLLLPPKD